MARKPLEPYREIERSIITDYRKTLWNPFIAAVKRYELISPGDRIAVCISGGKDSMLLAKLMQMLERISEVPFSLEFLVMDPGYRKENRKKIEDNAELLHIPIRVFESQIFDIANSSGGSPCYLCARMRRGHLYANAQALGCNKIALGHHQSDVIETTLMGMMYGAQIQGMLPRIPSTNFSGMELIRPLYCIREEDIMSWRDAHGLEFIRCACRFTENSAATEGLPKRQETKELIRELRRVNPNIEHNLFESIHNVQVDTLVGYKLHGEEHSFLEKFHKKDQNSQ